MNSPDSTDATIMPMVCLFDKKSRIWPAPAVYHGVEFAKRELLHAAKYGKGVDGRPPMFAEYPDDFTLIMVGKWDSTSGTVFPCREVVAEVADILKVE